jgi:DNA invertase Pin-like site-specific DNA recombinase
VLLSFAQFEREVTSERIRDKIAASKRKGLWVGGNLPLGYKIMDGKIAVVEEEAELVRSNLPAIFGTWKRQRTATGPQRRGDEDTIEKGPLFAGQMHGSPAEFDT